MCTSSILHIETISGEEIFELLLRKTNIELTRWDVLCNELFTGWHVISIGATDNVGKTILYTFYDVKE